MDSITDFSSLVVGGFAVGTLVGITGVGAGALMTPWLITVMRVRPEVAVGTDLLFAGITKVVGARAHARRGNVNWALTMAMIGGSVPATLLTLGWLQQRAGQLQNASTIRTSLALVLIATAFAVLFRHKLLAHASGGATPKTPNGSTRLAITALCGAALGVIVSLTSVGAGALGVTALMLIHPYLPTRQIVGSDVAHAVPLALIAGTGHAAMGHVDTTLLMTLLLGSLPGVALGCRLSTRVPELWVRRVLSILLLFAAWKLTQKQGG